MVWLRGIVSISLIPPLSAGLHIPDTPTNLDHQAAAAVLFQCAALHFNDHTAQEIRR